MTEIERINALLKEEDDKLTQRFLAPEMPVTFIVSLPRAASALFQQLAASVMRIGYISNIQARFWMAPYLGAMLEKDLQDPDFISAFKAYGSNYNPPGAHEPHEFGWFWQDWLRLEGEDHYCSDARSIDGRGLNGKLAAMEAAKEAPLLFDNVFAMANLHILKQILPRILVVHIKRDPYFVCNSIINAKLDRHGDIHAFHGHRPRNIEEILAVEDPVEQTVLQVGSIVDEIEKTLNLFDAAGIFTVSYKEIIGAPVETMIRFAEFLEGHGAKTALRSPLPEITLQSRNAPSLINPEYKDRLDDHFKRLFPSPSQRRKTKT